MYKRIKATDLGAVLVLNPQNGVLMTLAEALDDSGLEVYEEVVAKLSPDPKPAEPKPEPPKPAKVKQMRPKTADRHEQIIELRNAGKKIAEIAEALGISDATVTNHLTRAREEGRLNECK